MNIAFEWSKELTAEEKKALMAFLPHYVRWKYTRSFKNFLRLVRYDGKGSLYVFRFFYCLIKILSGKYQKIYDEYVDTAILTI